MQTHKYTSPDVVVPAELGPLLRVARHATGIPLRALSARAGVNHSHLSRFERGLVSVSLNLFSHAVVTLGWMAAHKDEEGAA